MRRKDPKVGWEAVSAVRNAWHLSLLLFSGSSALPLKCLSGWTIMANMWSSNRWEIVHTTKLVQKLVMKQSWINNCPEYEYMFCPFSRHTGNICRNSDWTGSVKLLRVEAEEAMLQTWVKFVIFTPQQPFCWLSEKCFAHIKNLKLIVCNDVTKLNEFSPKRHSFLFCCCSLLGVDKVIQYAVTEWITDIRKNQLPGILGGVGPMHSVVQLCEFELPHYCNGWIVVNPNLSFCPVHGVRDLFWLPIEQYRKDGRIIRGLQRGAASFGTSTASAALELSNRLVQAIQVPTFQGLFVSTKYLELGFFIQDY